ncbi:MAG: hypothetical protein C5B54_00070 [Acidobacteria bacterium]|nr:MAG: hypothetical protein C5B54_00070 [Acidobacteriota bacterium]
MIRVTFSALINTKARLMLDFPNSPQIGDLFPDPSVAGIPQWRWDGVRWAATSGQFLIDAPQDGLLYGRRDGNWSSVNIPELPDGVLPRTYVRGGNFPNPNTGTWLGMHFTNVVRDDFNEYAGGGVWAASKSGLVMVQAYAPVSVNGVGIFGVAVRSSGGAWLYQTQQGSGTGGFTPVGMAQVCGVINVSPGDQIYSELYNALTSGAMYLLAIDPELMIIWL